MIARRATLAIAAAVLVLGAGRAALANGRFPLANQLVVDPHDPAHLVGRVTFGLLNSTDAGRSWQWICEQAIGYSGVEDPGVAVTGDGTLIAASSRGLSVTHDGGCTWTRRPARFGIDVTVDPTNTHRALAVEAYLIDSSYSMFLIQTTDDGVTWNEPGVLLDSNFLAETIEVAPSNPDRVYISGRLYPSQESAMARSDDGGLTFTTFMVGAPVGETPYIGAIDPRDPDVVYVRTRPMVGPDAIGRVLMSRDGAATWREIWMGPGDAAGFALSGDGMRLAVGGPLAGVHVASTLDYAFQKVSGVGVRCLTWSAAGLFACAEEGLHGFSIGLSADEGATFSTVLRFADILPRSCPAGSSGAICLDVWSSVAPAIGIDAGAVDASVGGSAGGEESSGGCGCKFGRRRPESNVPWRLLVVVAAYIGWRRFSRSTIRFVI